MSPEEVVRAALAAHLAGDWRQLVSLVDPHSLDKWRRDFVEANTRIRSVDEWQSELPDAPRSAVEKLAERMAVQPRAFVTHLSDHIADVHTLEELERLSSAEVFVRVIQMMDPLGRLDRMTKAAYAAARLAPPEAIVYTRPDRAFEIIEQERISDTRVDVRFREEGSSDSETWPCVREETGQWRLLMGARLLSLPGADVTYIQDPVVIAYARKQSADERGS